MNYYAKLKWRCKPFDGDADAVMYDEEDRPFFLEAVAVSVSNYSGVATPYVMFEGPAQRKDGSRGCQLRCREVDPKGCPDLDLRDLASAYFLAARQVWASWVEA